MCCCFSWSRFGSGSGAGRHAGLWERCRVGNVAMLQCCNHLALCLVRLLRGCFRRCSQSAGQHDRVVQIATADLQTLPPKKHQKGLLEQPPTPIPSPRRRFTHTRVRAFPSPPQTGRPPLPQTPYYTELHSSSSGTRGPRTAAPTRAMTEASVEVPMHTFDSIASSVSPDSLPPTSLSPTVTVLHARL